MTIIFASDWQRYPGAIIDLKTRNTSFVRIASVYRSMGVVNHAFPLALHDKTLQGVDPFDITRLTLEQQLRIALECKNNYWYYFREIARVPAIGGTDSTLFEANRGNMALMWLFFNHIMQIVIQPRQTGKSFGADTLMTLLMNIVCTNTKINLMTVGDTLRRANIQRLKDIAAELPIYLQQKGPTDLNNTEEITINSLDNRYTTHVPQSSPKGAIKLGRGLTTPIFQIDEAPFQPNIAIALPAALAAMGAAVDKAAAEGAPYGTIITTTAGKKDDKDGRFVYNMLSESANWTERFLDAMNLPDLENMIRRNSRTGKLRVSCVFNHRQLGKTDDWLRRKLEESVQSGEDADRDFFNRWTSGSQTNPLSVNILEIIRNSSRDVKYAEISSLGGYITNWYINEDEIDSRMANGQFILGMDTSEASGGDDISLVLIDAVTLDLVAAGTFNETNLITFSRWMASWFVRFPNFVGIIERRSTGSTLIDYLLIMLPEMGIDPFKRLFNMIVHEKDEHPERYAEICQPMSRRDPSIYVRFKKSFGFATSGSGVTSRTTLYSTILRQATNKAAAKMYDKTLIDQITGLVTKNGRVDHEDGSHDDMVIGWLLCMWFLMSSMNLSHYGINTAKLMSKVEPEVYLDPYEAAEKKQQDNLRKQLDDLSTQLSKTTDEYISMKIEHQMRSIMGRISVEDNDSITSVDEMIRVARERRKTSRLDKYSSNNSQGNHWSKYQSPVQNPNGYFVRGN
jgi:hypothetical protein